MGLFLRRAVVTVVGLVVTAGGLAMLVLPGPGLLVVVAGLAVLATEYVWARRLLDRTRERALQAQRQAVASTWRTVGTLLFALGMVALGAVAVAVPEVPLLSGFSGSMLVVGGAVLLTTTVLTWRGGRRDEVAQ